MEPSNFPGRKNERRIVALENLKRRIARKRSLVTPPNKDLARMEAEAKVLEARIIEPAEARKIRSKVNRAGRGE